MLDIACGCVHNRGMRNDSHTDNILKLHHAGYTFGVLTIISPTGRAHMNIDSALNELANG